MSCIPQVSDFFAAHYSYKRLLEAWKSYSEISHKRRSRKFAFHERAWRTTESKTLPIGPLLTPPNRLAP
jgi:hypothetical protein